MMIKEKTSQGLMAAILTLSIITAVFFINLIIKKSLERENPTESLSLAAPERHKTQVQRFFSFPVGPAEVMDTNPSATSSKTGQKTGIIPDKEIIHEPSIKDNLLIQ